MKLPDQLARLAPEYRWLALTADLDTAHLIADAHKYFGRATASRPRIVKRFGAARVELLASLANQVGHRLLDQATDTSWRYLLREPKPLTELQGELKSFDIAWHDEKVRQVRNLAFDRSATSAGKLDAAERAFRLADRLEGGGAAGALYLGMVQAALGNHAAASKAYERLLLEVNCAAIRDCAMTNLLDSTYRRGDMERCSEYLVKTLDIADNNLRAHYWFNKAVIAFGMVNPHGFETCLTLAFSSSDSIRVRKHLLARMRYLNNWDDSNNRRKASIARIAAKILTGAN
jgi:tetratricopeptide (TPR) repeat protein